MPSTVAWRAWIFDAHLGRLQKAHPDQVGPNVTWSIVQGRGLSGRDLARADVSRAELFRRMWVFMTEYEFLVARSGRRSRSPRRSAAGGLVTWR